MFAAQFVLILTITFANGKSLFPDIGQTSIESEQVKDMPSAFLLQRNSGAGNKRDGVAIALFIGQITNGVVGAPPPAQGTAPLFVAQLEMNGWNLVFRATSGNGHNVYSAWMTGQNTSPTKPTDMSRSYSSHFRQDNLNWTNLNVVYVKFALYRDNREVGYVIFNAKGSDISNWFAKERVAYSSWSDLTQTAPYNIFSIVGDVRANLERRFVINTVYGGCPGDIGHVMVIEREGPCNMDKHPRYPQFVYADLNSADMWQKQQFGRADYMAIFVSH